MGLSLPMADVRAQPGPDRLRLKPGLGRKHLGALGNQDRRFTLHLSAVLQVFDGFDALTEQQLQASQGLARQGSTGFGRIALPGQGVVQVQPRAIEQGLGLGRPIGSQRILTTRTAQLVELFPQWLGSTLVPIGQLPKHLGQLLGRGIARHPGANTGRPLTRGGGTEGTAGQRVKRLHVGRLGTGLGILGGV